MKITQYPTLKEVLELHRLTIVKHGGAPGVRDLGLVESALYRPRSEYYQTFSEQAAALLQSFCMNRAFIDGNKRIALLATVYFFRLNGFESRATNTEFKDFTLNEVIQNKREVPEIAAWIKSKLKG